MDTTVHEWMALALAGLAVLINFAFKQASFNDGYNCGYQAGQRDAVAAGRREVL